MKLFGITGGIGMGKSTTGEWLERHKFAVIDTDSIARQVVEPGQPALAEIVQRFGKELLDKTGALRRDLLAKMVFENPQSLQALENILHPRIRKVWQGKVEEWRRAGEQAGFVIIPLLFETAAEKSFDSVICLACSSVTQQKRLSDRGWSKEQISQRLTAQWPVQKKMDAANYVIWTEGPLENQAAQLQRVLQLEAITSL